MHSHQNQAENEFRNIKLKLKGPNRHSELQAVKALMAMSAQHSVCGGDNKKPLDLSRAESPEPVYGLSIAMTEEDFKVLAEKEGIKDVIGEPVCRLCGGLFSGPLGIALHMCPAMRRQTYKCEICGEDKWKTKANLHSHIKWCKKRFDIKTGRTQQEHQQQDGNEERQSSPKKTTSESYASPESKPVEKNSLSSFETID